MPTRFYYRNLPHWQPDGAVIFVTFRVKGSLPAPVLKTIIAMREAVKKNSRSEKPMHPNELQQYKRMFAIYDEELGKTCHDSEHASSVLHIPQNAEIVRGCIKHGQSIRKFILHRYCIMPNHVHLLIEPLLVDTPVAAELKPQWPPVTASLMKQPTLYISASEPQQCHPLETIMGSLKSSIARRINALTSQSGPLFQRENFDHWVRDYNEYVRVIQYIDLNPVKARLCKKPEHWKWSSIAEETFFKE